MHALATVLVLSIVATLLAATVTVASSMSTSRDHAFDARQAIRLRNVLVGSGALLVAALIPPPLLLLGLENDLACASPRGLPPRSSWRSISTPAADSPKSPQH